MKILLGGSRCIWRPDKRDSSVTRVDRTCYEVQIIFLDFRLFDEKLKKDHALSKFQINNINE